MYGITPDKQPGEAKIEKKDPIGRNDPGTGLFRLLESHPHSLHGIRRNRDVSILTRDLQLELDGFLGCVQQLYAEKPVVVDCGAGMQGIVAQTIKHPAGLNGPVARADGPAEKSTISLVAFGFQPVGKMMQNFNILNSGIVSLISYTSREYLAKQMSNSGLS